MTITLTHSLIVMFSLPLATLMYYRQRLDSKSISTRFITTVINFNYSLEVVNIVKKYVVDESHSTVL